LSIVFIGLGEILSLLPTYPFKGSKFHVVLFQNIFFVGWFNLNFENGFEEKDERPRRHEIWKQVRLVQFIYENG